MTKRIIHIIVLCLLTSLAWSQDFDEMVTGMSELSLPLVNVEVELDSVSFRYFVPGTFTLYEYKDGL